MTEYVLLLAFAMLMLVGLMGLFMDGIGDFYRNLQHIICVPFP